MAPTSGPCSPSVRVRMAASLRGAPRWLTASTICARVPAMPVAAAPDRIEAIRAFNRFYTGRIGVLREDLRAPRAGELGWIVERHGALYAAEHGWGAGFEALVAEIVAGFARSGDAAGQRAWIAEAGGRAAGCVLCVRRDDAVAALRLLLV